mgnify:CR=1 FL=1
MMKNDLRSKEKGYIWDHNSCKSMTISLNETKEGRNRDRDLNRSALIATYIYIDRDGSQLK